MSVREGDIRTGRPPSDTEYRPETKPDRERDAMLKQVDGVLTALGRMTSEMRELRASIQTLTIKS